jgi:hypothetical protein
MTRMVDRNGMRGGAGISAALLLLAFVGHDGAWQWLVPLMAVALGIGSVLGLRYSPLGATYRLAKVTFKLSIPVEPEEEPPPRFAQTLGFVVLSLATICFALGWTGAGWLLTLLVAGLQGLLAGTGLCVGCEIYIYGKRFTPKGA